MQCVSTVRALGPCALRYAFRIDKIMDMPCQPMRQYRYSHRLCTQFLRLCTGSGFTHRASKWCSLNTIQSTPRVLIGEYQRLPFEHITIQKLSGVRMARVSLTATCPKSCGMQDGWSRAIEVGCFSQPLSNMDRNIWSRLCAIIASRASPLASLSLRIPT